MKSTLQQLYYGGLDPQAERNYPLPREPFFSRLAAQSPELEKAFNDFMTEVNRTYVEDTEEMFYQGFSLAVKLLAEALTN